MSVLCCVREIEYLALYITNFFFIVLPSVQFLGIVSLSFDIRPTCICNG